MKFNEDSRVKIPAILHLTQLGYKYISLKDAVWDEDTNIFTDIFKSSMTKVNPDLSPIEIDRLYQDVALDLENEDLGKAFYNKLINRSGTRLIDFENFENNDFHVVTELTYKNGEDEFRPDVICLINGMPLVFIEVKKPNNRDGVLAERKRIITRFQNKKFRKFVNLTQFMIFSNNMEYDDNEIEPWQGAFYASPSYVKPIFNYFREEIGFNLSQVLKPFDESVMPTSLIPGLSISTPFSKTTNSLWLVTCFPLSILSLIEPVFINLSPSSELISVDLPTPEEPNKQ